MSERCTENRIGQKAEMWPRRGQPVRVGEVLSICPSISGSTSLEEVDRDFVETVKNKRELLGLGLDRNKAWKAPVNKVSTLSLEERVGPQALNIRKIRMPDGMYGI